MYISVSIDGVKCRSSETQLQVGENVDIKNSIKMMHHWEIKQKHSKAVKSV